jgi:hypothetical protein
MTPLRLRKLVRLLRGHPPPYVAATLAALPDASARATVTEAVTAAGLSSE